MMPRVLALLLVGLPMLPACGGRDDTPQGKEQAQLEVIQRRLDALDQRLATTEKDLAAGARLRDDLQALEQRVGAAEAKVSQALEAAKQRPPAPAAGPTGAPVASAPRHAPDPAERRAQLAELMTEYRRRLTALSQQDPQASPSDRMAGRRSLREWYIAHRRAILAGRPLPDWHPQTD
jgi:hypothetical protein